MASAVAASGLAAVASAVAASGLAAAPSGTGLAEDVILTGTAKLTPASSAISYVSAASTAPSYAATAPSASVMPGFALTFAIAPASSRPNMAGDSPTDGSVTITHSAFLEFSSPATTILWRDLLQLPYTACLYSDRDVARSDVPSMITIATSHPFPFSPNHSRPSTSSSPIPIELILFWNVENDGVRNRPAAVSLASPASCLYLIPVTSLYIPAATNTSLLYTRGRPLLPLFSSSRPPNAVPSLMSNT